MYRSLLCLFTFLAAPVVANAADDFKLESGFTLLFNGKDLSGWKVAPNKDKDKSGDSLEGKAESPTKRFVVTDGVIVIDGKVKGDIAITTEKTFAKDAHIKFDFKPGKGCNNDLFFRGIKFDIKSPDIKNMKEDEWNTFEIVVTGTQAEIKCNGELVKKQTAKAGATPLSIRAEFGAIDFRRIRIKSE